MGQRMITLRVSQRARRRALSARLSRRHPRFAPICENLETRQLLSVSAFPAHPVGVGSPPPASVQPSVSVLPPSTVASPGGLSPNQIRVAYGVNQVGFNGNVVGNGAGQTIAIIDAYYDPNIASDLGKFDAQYGLSAPPSLSQYVQNGLGTANAGWGLETALDVEWAHSMAPAANIDLIEAAPDTTDLFGAVHLATGLPGVSVVSMSFGTNEFAGQTSFDSVFTTPAGHNGITFVASSGDSSMVQYPSSSPNVLSVGGTTLNVSNAGSYVSETAWNGSGGGKSLYEAEPSYQSSVQATNSRTTPDVAFNANPSSGVSVYSSIGTGSSPWQVVGGTSIGAPAWAGLVAIADQGLTLAGHGTLTTSQLGASLYSPSLGSAFNNISPGTTGSSVATTTYNLVTGLGSPKVNVLISALVPTGSLTIHAGTISGTFSTIPVPVRALDLQPVSSTSSTPGGSGSSASTGSNSSSTTSITPLTPIILSGSAINVQAPVVIIVQQPVVTHLGPSTEPVTTQSILAATLLEEFPTISISTHFGQGSGNELVEPIAVQPFAIKPEGAPPIDFIVPFEAPPAEKAPAPQPAAPAKASQARPRPSFSRLKLEAALDLADWDLLAMSPTRTSSDSEARQDESQPSWIPSSSIFGATAVAMGGYQLILRHSESFRGRWIPARPESRRRRFSLPTL